MATRTDLITLFDAGVQDGVTPLITQDVLNGLDGRVQKTIRARFRYDERETFDIYYDDTNTHVGYSFTHIQVRADNGVVLNPVPYDVYIYRIDTAEKADSNVYGTLPAYSQDGNGNGIVMRYTCTLDVFATAYYRSHSTGETGRYLEMSGRWNRLPSQPTMTDTGGFGGALPGEPFQIRPAQMMRSREVRLPCITDDEGGHKMVFVKATVMDNNGKFKIYGFFCLENVNVVTIAVRPDQNSAHYAYPTLYKLMNDTPNVLNITDVSQLIDISVSERCPLSYTVGQTPTYYIMNCTGTVRNLGGTYGCVDITEEIASAYNEEIMILTMTEQEVNMGRLSIRTVDGNLAGSIDTRYACYDPSYAPAGTEEYWMLAMIVRTRAGYTDITTEIILPDGSPIRFTEGHLPYSSDVWQAYVRTQYQYDREMNRIQQDKAQAELLVGLTTSLTNGLLTSAFNGGLGAVTAGVGAVGNAINYSVEEDARQRTFEAKKDLMRAQPDSGFVTDQGIGYVTRCIMEPNPACIILSMPGGVDASEYSEYVKSMGYPVSDHAETVRTTELPDEGFIQCNRLTGAGTNADPVLFSGFWRIMLERQLRQGVRFKRIITQEAEP